MERCQVGVGNVCARAAWHLVAVGGAAAFALAACNVADEHHQMGDGQVNSAAGGSGGGAPGAGGNGGSPPSPDAGTPGNPVAEPPMGLDPNNQVNPGPLPGDAHFNFDALRARGEMLRADHGSAPGSAPAGPLRPVRSAVVIHDDARQAGAGGRARSAPGGVTWDTLAAMRPSRSRRRSLPGGFLPLPHPNQDEGGMVLPAVDHRRDQAADRAQSEAVRSRLRHPRALPAGVPARDLPDHAAGSR